MTHKSKITPATSPLFCNHLPSKTDTTANIDATFPNVQHSKVYSKQFSSRQQSTAVFVRGYGRAGHGSGPTPSTDRVGSRFFPYFVGRVGSGPIVWVCVGPLGDTECYAKCNCKVYI